MRRIICTLCFAVLFGLQAHAQEAQLTGLITDPTGAVIPQATIALRNEATGVKYQTVSNGAGFYTFPFVKPGSYEITVEKDRIQNAEPHGRQTRCLAERTN